MTPDRQEALRVARNNRIAHAREAARVCYADAGLIWAGVGLSAAVNLRSNQGPR